MSKAGRTCWSLVSIVNPLDGAYRNA